MYKNEFVTSIISTNIRNVLNDSFGSHTELVRSAYDTSSTQRTVQAATNGTVLYRSMHACNKGCN